MTSIPEFSLSTDKTRLTTVPFEEAGSYGRRFKDRKYLIMHYTAGRGFDSTVAHFKDPASKASAHLVVGRKTGLMQMVPFDRPAWHAGADSQWTYLEPFKAFSYQTNVPPPPPPDPVLHGMNFYALGIEFDNYGPLRKVGRSFVTWFGREVPFDEVGEVDPKASGSFGVQFWHAYSSSQIEIAERLAKVLVRGFGLRGILGHSDVSPGRKTDPGPLFPMAHLRAIIFGRADDEPVDDPKGVVMGATGPLGTTGAS